MIQLPQLQESLLIANERLVDRARRRARLFRTGLVTSAAVVSIGGAAAAGIAIWSPQLGHEDGNRPSASSSPVPSAQLASLAVLRREQTAGDRSAVAQRALAVFSKQYVGVRLAAVRVVQRGPGTAGLAVVPVAQLTPQPGAGPAARTDALCAFASGEGDATANTCFSLSDVQRGRAIVGLGDTVRALVPDGVASVSFHGSDGQDHQTAVSDNAFAVDVHALDPARPDVEWLADDGHAIEPDGGTDMRLQALAAPAPVTTDNGFHDCGTADGGIVPTDVACGAAARQWAPETGQTVPPSAPKAK